ncbi:hypothetical protein AURDEDRAFT_187407 [Auricularia subglabra TFB-10046 SS5]|nr:hypothetical protein AURDEDRAFT_187407 [Auricularia subglabra TFB-10046 SS5]
MSEGEIAIRPQLGEHKAHRIHTATLPVLFRMAAPNSLSYERPASAMQSTVVAAVIQPLGAPPSDRAPPYIPASRGACDAGWTRSTHVFPAAYPRKPALRAPQGGWSSAEVWDRIEAHHNGRWKHIQQHEGVLWTVAERYARPNAAGATVTLVCAHGTGLHKETFDETLRHLLASGSPGGRVINEVWTIDAVTQGESGRMNASALPDIYDWTDHVRDILNFIVAYLPASPGHALTSVLPRLSGAESERRCIHGLAERKLVAVGHSLGGTCMSLAASELPSLFDSLVLVDPGISAPVHQDPGYATRVAGALLRRNGWPSRAHAAASLARTPFFGKWHPAALHSYVSHALYASPSGEVRLKCTPYQEAASYAERRIAANAWHRLAEIPARVALFWIIAGGNANDLTGGDEGTPHTVWRRPVNSTNMRVPGAGHMEQPEALGNRAPLAHLERLQSHPLHPQLGPDARRVETIHAYLAVMLAGTYQLLISPLIFCWAWIVRLQRTRAGAERAYAGVRYELLDGVLLPPVYALYVAYRLGTERWYQPLAVYASQAAVWLWFFCRLQREALERAAAAGADGLAPV